MRRDVHWLVLLAVIQVGLWPSGAQAQGSPTIAVRPGMAEPGDAVVVRGQGWDDDCAVVLTLDSDEGPRLGSAVPDQGAFTAEVTVPADAAPGDHRLVATGRVFGDVDAQPATCGGPSGTRATATLVARPEAAALVLSRDDVDFGAVEVGDAAEEGLLATNVSPAALEGVVVDLEAAGETFAVTDDACTGRPLRPQESCALAVAFRPDATADARATLVVTSDDLDAPATATLTGTGVPVGRGLVAVLGELPWALVVLLGLATVGVTKVARGRSRRWLRAHVRLDPHGAAPIEATVDQPDGEPSTAIRLEPHADAGTQSLHKTR